VLPSLAEMIDPAAVAGPLLQIVAESVLKLLPAALYCHKPIRPALRMEGAILRV
jgi:hypothetical protein